MTIGDILEYLYLLTLFFLEQKLLEYDAEVVQYISVAGEGMGGALYWQDFISIMKDLGFSTPRLVAASRIDVHNPELRMKAGRSA